MSMSAALALPSLQSTHMKHSQSTNTTTIRITTENMKIDIDPQDPHSDTDNKHTDTDYISHNL